VKIHVSFIYYSGGEGMRLGELLLMATGKTSEDGSIAGVCIICSRNTDKGHKVKDILSDNFTGWSM